MRRDLSNQSGDGPNQGGYGATFQAKAERAQLSRPRRRERDFPDHHGDGAIKNQFLATKAETAQLFRPRRRQRDFSDQGGEGATFQTIAETARPMSRLLRSNFGMFKSLKVELNYDSRTNYFILIILIDKKLIAI